VGEVARTSGRVVGKALTGYDGDDTGVVMVLINNGYWQTPLQFDLSKLFNNASGVATLASSIADTKYVTTDIGLTPVTTSGLNQEFLDQIHDGFIAQQTALQALADRVGALEQSLKQSDKTGVQISDTVTQAVTFTSDVSFKGFVRQSSKMLGTAKVPAGKKDVTVSFSQAFPSKPLVFVSSDRMIKGEYWKSDVDVHGFRIVLDQAQTEDITFDWYTALSGDE
jgi:hypothetical protein